MSAIQRYVYKAGEVNTGGQQVVNLNYLSNPFHATILVKIVSGTVAYGIEATHDDLDGDPANFQWVDILPSGQVETKLFKIDTSVTGLRLTIQSISGVVHFSVIQGVGLL